MTEVLASARVVKGNGTPVLLHLLRSDPLRAMRGAASNAISGTVVGLAMIVQWS